MFGGDEVSAVVIDIGQGSVKAGWAGEDAPKVCFPSYVGLKGSRDKADFVMGSSALTLRRDDMEVVQPYLSGKVTDWELYLSLVEHTLTKELGPEFDVKGHPLVFSETTHVSERDRERFLEALFEKFSPPAVFFCKSAVLAAFAAAKTTALVVEVGSGVTCVTPVFDGFALQKAAVRCPITGDGLTNLLIDALAQDGVTIRPRYSFKKKVAPGASAEEFSVVDVPGTDGTHASYRNMCIQHIAEDLKLSVCRVSETALTPATIGSGVLQSASYELPDGRVVNVASPRFTVAESLFHSSLLTEEKLKLLGLGSLDQYKSIVECIMEAVQRSDTDLKRDLYFNIILSGGTTLLPGFKERLEKELTERLHSAFRVRVVTTAAGLERRHGVWIGGSILASLGSFQQMWLSKQEFMEHGATIVHSKCP